MSTRTVSSAPSSALVLLLLASLAAPRSARAQASTHDPDPRLRPISLARATDAAIAGNSRLAVAEAERDIAAAQGRQASSRLWPQLGLEAAYTRSTDPVFAFGTKLRQGEFEQSDFQLESLNDPAAIADFSASFGALWSVLDPKVWTERAAARNQARAAFWSAERTREATVLVTRQLYHRAASWQAQLEAAAAAEEAARSTVESFRRRRERGLLTEADLLQAEAEHAASRARSSQAGAARIDALEDLGRHLGWAADSLPLPSDTLTAPGAIAELEFVPGRRADLLALAAVEEATGATRRVAAYAFVPAIDAFARLATHSRDVFAVEEDDWTVGLVLRWPVFTGLARVAGLERANLERRIARIRYEAAVRDAQAESDQAARAVRSARQQVEASQAAHAAATGGRDLMRRRFEEGLATASDLLQAEARATGMRERAISALASYHTAVARLEFARSQSNRGN